MSGYCSDCGNTLCICSEISSNTRSKKPLRNMLYTEIVDGRQRNIDFSLMSKKDLNKLQRRLTTYLNYWFGKKRNQQKK
jgi:hypothetical protein